MATYELVVHHRYTSRSLSDLSGNANDGHISPPLRDGDVSEVDGIRFDGRSTRVVMFPSVSLADLGGIRARARVRVDELGDRRTIAEGYLAFSFSVERDGGLAGSVYIGTHWHEIATPPNVVPLGRWVDVSFIYDGCDSAMLCLDGSVVASRYAALGAVPGVQWPYGLNIGAWPDHDLRVFSGRIAEFWLWKIRRRAGQTAQAASPRVARPPSSVSNPDPPTVAPRS
jgi:hypothetical protein